MLNALVPVGGLWWGELGGDGALKNSRNMPRRRRGISTEAFWCFSRDSSPLPQNRSQGFTHGTVCVAMFVFQNTFSAFRCVRWRHLCLALRLRANYGPVGVGLEG
jgi:hypothetical protein